MRAPSFLILAAVTLLVTVAAGVAVMREENPRTAIETGGRSCPDWLTGWQTSPRLSSAIR